MLCIPAAGRQDYFERQTDGVLPEVEQRLEVVREKADIEVLLGEFQAEILSARLNKMGYHSRREPRLPVRLGERGTAW
jgi:hypothetical protein